MPFPSVPACLNTSENDLAHDLFEPCLDWATRFDRGVGFFTSGWLYYASRGMASFASRGGHARWITSPIIEQKDYEVITGAKTTEIIIEYYRAKIDEGIDALARELEANTLNALAWMLYDGIVELRFAVPKAELNGDFHDKFGIFSDNEGNGLSFSGSINDSIKGFANYESIKVFTTWDGTERYVDDDKRRFERLWNNIDANVAVFSADEAISRKLFRLRVSDRPYRRESSEVDNRWEHQNQAVQVFLEKKAGILEMATGTGKTRTALRIIQSLFDTGKIERTVVTMYGNDLLKQWVKECLCTLSNDIHIFRNFETEKELTDFLLSRRKALLIISRDADLLFNCVSQLEKRLPNKKDSVLFVFDEVHGLGSQSFRKKLSGKFSQFGYRLGLSATPDREYDEIGNRFIQNEVGEVIFRFGLEKAIEKGILCEFDYFPISFSLTDEDKRKKRSIIAAFSAKKEAGELVADEELYQALAKVNKLSPAKLPLFESFIRKHPEILERCLIFVETRDYGEEVQRILIKYLPAYHTYYGDDDEINLAKFARGELDCLVTCKKISEGIDIKTVKNIILFSSDRSKLVTTQRIGRSLRIDPHDPLKRAAVVDFICEPSENSVGEINADEERREWLLGLSKIRREQK